MTANKQTVTSFMDGFKESDRALILSCLTDDIEWQVPGAFHSRGKKDFETHIVAPGFVEKPAITMMRLTEEDDVVVAEGSVRTERTDGTFVNLVFCDVFDLHQAKIRRLISYLVQTS